MILLKEQHYQIYATSKNKGLESLLFMNGQNKSPFLLNRYSYMLNNGNAYNF